MPGRWTAFVGALGGLLALAASGCSSGDGEVALQWQTEDGRPLDIILSDPEANYDTVIYVDNESGETIRDAVLRFSPGDVRHAPVGFSVGTITTIRTDFDGAAHLWHLGDIRPGTRVVFPLSLWFSASQQLGSAPPLDLVVELQSDGQNSAIAGALTVHFQP